MALKKIVLLLAFTFSLANAHAQKAKKDSTEKNVKFLPIPYVGYNRNTEFQLGVIPMMMFPMNKRDSISPQSMVGVAAIYTSNDSYYVIGFSRLFFREDRWRITMASGLGDQNSQTFLHEVTYPGLYDFTSSYLFGQIIVQRKIKGHWYGGLAYTYSRVVTEFDDSPDIMDDTNNGLTFSLMADHRDNVYYPYKGALSKLKWNTFPAFLRNETVANSLSLEFNKYNSVRKEKDIVAARLFTKIGLGTIDFAQQVVIGNKDIRGYSLGEYRGDGMIAVQAEYRWNFMPRMGAVAFAGIATLYGSENPSYDWDAYPGIGLGYRFTAFTKNHLNIGLDAAVGKGDWSLNFRIGENF